MSILDYTDGSHLGGFTGYRVCITIAGKDHQHYFSADDYESAVKVNKKLTALRDKENESKKKNKQIAYKAKRFDNPHKTPVHGIRLDLNFKPGSLNYYPCFSVASSTDGTLFTATRLITPTTRTLPVAWRECCKLLAGFRGLKRVPGHWYKAQPDAKQFFTLRKHFMKKRKLTVPMSAIEHLRECEKVQ